MSKLGTILQKLGIEQPAASMAPTIPAPTAKPWSAAPLPRPAAAPIRQSPPPAAAPMPTPMAMVDVVSKLDNTAGENPGLDWKVSIVDMLKLLDMDSSLSARKALATELGCPPELIGGNYSEMNVWLHQTVLQKIAENGGNIPQSLLQ